MLNKNSANDYLESILVLHKKKGWFTPPFPTEEQLLKILDRLYLQTDYNVDGSIAYFRCIKGE